METGELLVPEQCLDNPVLTLRYRTDGKHHSRHRYDHLQPPGHAKSIKMRANEGNEAPENGKGRGPPCVHSGQPTVVPPQSVGVDPPFPYVRRFALNAVN